LSLHDFGLFTVEVFSGCVFCEDFLSFSVWFDIIGWMVGLMWYLVVCVDLIVFVYCFCEIFLKSDVFLTVHDLFI